MISYDRMKELAESYGLTLSKVKPGEGGINLFVDGEEKRLSDIGYDSLFKETLSLNWDQSVIAVDGSTCFGENSYAFLAA